MDWVTFFWLYGISVPLFLLCDLLWLGFFAKGFYRSQLAHVMGEIQWPAALLFYGLFLVGLVIFAIFPAARQMSVGLAAGWGALYGFFTYMTYDLTNLATLKNWPLPVVIVDIVWGTALGAVVAATTVAVYANLFAGA